MTQSDFWSEELPANHSALQGYAKDLTIQEATLLSPMLEFLTDLDPSGAYGKMCQVSSVLGGGRDFGSFLGALAELGYGWAYRVLDAQNFGVAQRRRRVFVIGHLGDWKPAAEVLFESESLRGDIKKGRGEKQDSTTGFVPSVANTLQTTCNDYSRADGFNMIAYEWHNQDSRIKPVDIAATLNCNAGGREGHLVQNIPFVQQPIPEYYAHQYCQDRVYSTEGITPALNCSQAHKFRFDLAVRRLTPVECERLQGFPDNYTNIPKAADGNRYKALGNSMAVPVMRWIGQRIDGYEQRGMEKHLRG
jgi:DNA (cytosine-5)-methyltransferase 1